MRKLLFIFLLSSFNEVNAQAFTEFFGIDSNEIHYQIWLSKYSNSFDSVIKFHSIQLSDNLKAFEDSLSVCVYLDGKNNLKVELNNELMVSIKKLKYKLIVNERELIHEFTFNKTIKRIKLIHQGLVTKVRFSDGKILRVSKSYELEKNYVDEAFLIRMKKCLTITF